MSPSDGSEAPVEIACTLESGAMPQRLEDWQRVLSLVRTRTETPDGRLRVEFESAVDVGELARLVAAEQQCCAFFSFALTIDRRGVALEVDAPETATEIVTALFGTA
jgi:hypothetical protein